MHGPASAECRNTGVLLATHARRLRHGLDLPCVALEESKARRGVGDREKLAVAHGAVAHAAEPDLIELAHDFEFESEICLSAYSLKHAWFGRDSRRRSPPSERAL